MYAKPIQEQLDYLVYDSKYELDLANLKLLQTLGSGHYGDVYLGILKQNGAKIPVAVKKTKQLANIQHMELKSPEECDKIWQMERDSLRDELKIMGHIGNHSNVVRLLGAITTSRDDYCIVTEYCEYGSLDTFLQNKMDLGLFINEIVTEDSAGYVVRGRDCVYKSMQDITWDSQFEARRSEGVLTTSDLLWFALQMARAMEYLTQLSVVHRDVALRNVLLKSDFTLKVADFGLSRLASDDGYYYQQRNVAMPIRYTAPEAMKIGRFSEHSECWAYGIALWDLFTFSKKQPYAEECPEGYNGILAFLTAGNRLTVPSTAPKPILNCGSQDMDEGKASSPNVTWTINKGHILLNGEQLVLKGINYFGFESEEFMPYGLSSQSLDFLLAFIRENNFNAVRLWFSIEMIQKNPKTKVDCAKNEDLCKLKALELMEAVVDRCAERGVLVVLSCTQLAAGSDYNKPNGLWYDDGIPTYTEEKVLEAWDVLMNLVKKKWNLLALDVLDQPRYTVSWGTSNTDTDFNQYTERFVKHISSKHAEFTGFFFVEGIDKNDAFQGEDLMGVRDSPISTGNMEYDKRIIYSPHSFGPDVYNKTYFNVSNFPKNMPSYWEKFYGYITTSKDNPVIIGSWGGKYQEGTSDETWHNAFITWLQEKCLTNQFYYGLNEPNDTPFGEPLLGDAAIPNRRKLDLLNKLQPHPTRLRYIASTSELRITPGRFPNTVCNI
uniref:Protein kinase domain-containing protein n=1 Tax=Plectus sambesii TaxID=2011161 RepID=A0A914VWP2_9BILA